MSELITEISWHGDDLAIGHTVIKGKPYKVIVESED